MKRLSAIIICCLLIFNTIMPMVSYAEDKNSIELDKAFSIVEKTLNIKTEGYDVKSSYATNTSGKNVWILNLTSKNDSKGSFNVSIDAITGNILNFDRVVIDNNKYGKIPKYTKQSALEVAKNFIKSIQADKYEELQLKETKEEEAKNYNFYSDIYNFKFVRIINKIEYEENGIKIGVNKNNLSITNYNFEWDDIDFTDASKVIKIEDAKMSFADKIGLQLNYYSIFRYDLQKNKTALVYSLKRSSKPIDALTGGAITLNYKDTVAEGSLVYTTDKKFKNYTVPGDKDKIEPNDIYITKQKAYEVLNVALGLGNKYKISEANLYNQNNVEGPAWFVKLTPIAIDKNNARNSVIAEVDAVNSELRCFLININENDTKKEVNPIYTNEQCRKIAEEFVKKMQPKKLVEVAIENNSDETNNVINFTRKVNDIAFPYDGISVNVSPLNGRILSYNMNWSNVLLPSNDNIMKLDEAYNNLFKKLNFKLKYIKAKDFKTGENEIKLAYVLDDFSGLFNAKTGELLDYNCDIIDETKLFNFVDIKGIPQEKDIKLLAEMGVIENNREQFIPNAKILQKDFIKFLVKTLDETEDLNNNQLDYDFYYDLAIKKKIIAIADKSPNAEVSREEASKMVIRALDLGYVAELNNIYTLPFNDTDKIDSKYIGYVSLVSQLKIINGVNLCFYPKITLSRGDAATILVNYLRVIPDVKE